MYNVELRSQRSQTNQNERKEGCGLKYRVVSILKDNRPRFLIISDIEEIEILPSKYLKHLDQINASPNTVKSAAFALSYYYNYLQEQTIGLDEITLLSYSEQNKHFIDFCIGLRVESILSIIHRRAIRPAICILVQSSDTTSFWHWKMSCQCLKSYE